MPPHWRDRIGPPPLQWTKERDGTWSALDGRFRVVHILDERWALEDATRQERTVGFYASCMTAQGVAAYVVENEHGNPKKTGR
jgi:hypothetical protein